MASKAATKDIITLRGSAAIVSEFFGESLRTDTSDLIYYKATFCIHFLL